MVTLSTVGFILVLFFTALVFLFIGMAIFVKKANKLERENWILENYKPKIVNCIAFYKGKYANETALKNYLIDELKTNIISSEALSIEMIGPEEHKVTLKVVK